MFQLTNAHAQNMLYHKILITNTFQSLLWSSSG